MKAHPSGRPIRHIEKRNYSMMSRLREGFVCPRLNETIRPRHDTHAVGVIAHPPDDNFWHGMEAKR